MTIFMQGLLIGFGVSIPVYCSGEERLVRRVYNVGDLLPVDDKGRMDDARLTKVLQSIISPRSWDGAAGRGTMNYFPLGMTLVVQQIPAVHRELNALLQSMRTAPIPWDRLQ